MADTKYAFFLWFFFLLGAPLANSDAVEINDFTPPSRNDVIHLSEQARHDASQLIEAGNTQEAIRALKHTEAIVATIEDPYTHVNHLRYLGELYHMLSITEDAERIFNEATILSATVQPIDRQLSAYIGLVETQSKIGLQEGARATGMHAVHDGLIEAVSATGKTGETNRLLENLNDALYTHDVQEILKRLLHVPQAVYRIRVLMKLNTLTYKDGAYADTTDRLLQAWPQTEPFELLLLYCLSARLVDDDSSQRYLDMAIEQSIYLDTHRDRALAIIYRTQSLLAHPPTS